MRRNVIVIGASAGGVEALRTLVSLLPTDLPATILVVLHIPAYGGSVLPAILNRAGPLPARHPIADEPLPASTILVAPPDHHLAVGDDRALLTRGPNENGHRPAIDVLFRSAALACGARVIGVVLSGVLDDGTAGLSAIAARGGTTVVQDPADAVYPGMPQSAIAHVGIDYVLAVDQIGALLVKLCTEEIDDDAPPVPPLMKIEGDLATFDESAMNEHDCLGESSGFSCPDCSGVLEEIRDGGIVRYRCRVGHAWSAESLFGEQGMHLDTALWMALRGLEEKAALARTLGERARERANPLSAGRFAEQDAEASRAASLIRSMLEAHVGLTEETGA